MTVKTEDGDLIAGYTSDLERPIRSYGLLIGVFSGLAAGFAVWFRASERQLPDRIDAQDLALLTVASHKAARMIAKDRVTSAIRAPFAELQDEAGPAEVSEKPRGRGLRRAIGELLVCPYCLGMWTSAAFTAGLLVAPRFTRWLASVWVIFFGSDVLQIVYKKAEDTL